MSDRNTKPSRKALSADEVTKTYRSNPENDRLYLESEIGLDLAERMTSMRRLVGFSQHELANRVGCKQPFVARLEKGDYGCCELRTLRTFARAMGHDLDVARMFVKRIGAKPTPAAKVGTKSTRARKSTAA